MPKAEGAAHPAGAAVQPEITGFRIALRNFEGPFDLLLQLIQSRKLDVTEVALAEVTDEFVAYTRQLGEDSDLNEVTQFLLIAATLLDLKAARLLPRGEAAEIEDAELLESRDLLFARLLQYRAYKKVADQFAVWQRQARHAYPRAVGLEERFAALMPPVRLGHSAESFARVAAGVFRPRPPEEVATGHVHRVAVSVPEQAGRIMRMLTGRGAGQWVSFVALTRDCEASMQVVGRFLALLELFKARAVDVAQPEPLGNLDVAWTGLDVDPAVVAAANWD